MEETISLEVGKILENWAMMLIEPAEASPTIFCENSKLYVAVLEFKGVVDGECKVVSQEAFGGVLVNNLLGSDDEPSPEAVQDALKEMVNVMSGNLLTVTYGVDTVFDLTPPQVHEATREEVAKLFERPAFCYIADDHPVAVSFCLKV